MTFWDTSALVPLFVEQGDSQVVRPLAEERPLPALWWGSVVECWSAFARLRREGAIDRDEEADARHRLEEFKGLCHEILPSEDLRVQAGHLIHRHPLRAADALQLAAAMVSSGSPPVGEFVTFDARLREAARLEGLTPIPG